MPDALPRRKAEADIPRPDRVEKGERPEAVVKRLSEVEEEEIRWLWPGRLAFGKFNILDGDPGEGKSLFTVDLAARVTTGRPLPGFT
ncbi:MAG TPA: AAA family ATPase, partial [Thermoanaerobaculia bacterium]|nr:AAA family ATPase [Thermoanaerobaculia bacterium]